MSALPSISLDENYDAILVLASGKFFLGKGIGKKHSVTGEICFNTALTGYQEILTDPSYTGQIITFTMPHIGNVGVNSCDSESLQKFANGLIIREEITEDSNFRAMNNLNGWLRENDLTGISGIDTRELTILIREEGACNCVIYFGEKGEKIELDNLLETVKKAPSLKGAELSSKVSTTEIQEPEDYSYYYLKPEKVAIKHHIVVIDYGIKSNILNCLLEVGCELTVVNCQTSATEILALEPDGIFLSNGPGDPDANALYSTTIIKELLDKNIPIFGICMGHQLLALAAGLKTFKMEQGHRGANHPVKNLQSGKVEITSQNHGFCVENKNLPKNVEVTHISLFDQTIEGIRLTDKPAFSVQYHPESSPGPHDSRYLFEQFMAMIEG